MTAYEIISIFIGILALLMSFGSTTDINEKLIKIKWKIRCGIGVEENDSSVYLRFTSPPKNLKKSPVNYIPKNNTND